MACGALSSVHVVSGKSVGLPARLCQRTCLLLSDSAENVWKKTLKWKKPRAGPGSGRRTLLLTASWARRAARGGKRHTIYRQIHRAIQASAELASAELASGVGRQDVPAQAWASETCRDPGYSCFLTGGVFWLAAPWCSQPGEAPEPDLLSPPLPPPSLSARATVATQDPDCQFPSDQRSWWSLRCKKTMIIPQEPMERSSATPTRTKRGFNLHLVCSVCLFVCLTYAHSRLCLNQNLTIS